jgi:hypothetical protein
LGKTFTLTQNKGLYVVSGAYKIILARYLKLEIAIWPLNLYFDKWVVDFEHGIVILGCKSQGNEIGCWQQIKYKAKRNNAANNAG